MSVCCKCWGLGTTLLERLVPVPRSYVTCDPAHLGKIGPCALPTWVISLATVLRVVCLRLSTQAGRKPGLAPEEAAHSFPGRRTRPLEISPIGPLHDTLPFRSAARGRYVQMVES